MKDEDLFSHLNNFRDGIEAKKHLYKVQENIFFNKKEGMMSRII